MNHAFLDQCGWVKKKYLIDRKKKTKTDKNEWKLEKVQPCKKHDIVIGLCVSVTLLPAFKLINNLLLLLLPDYRRLLNNYRQQNRDKRDNYFSTSVSFFVSQKYIIQFC